MHPDIFPLHQAAAFPDLGPASGVRSPLFVCTVAYTATVRIPGISAAGATPELRELTAAADAELLLHGAPVCMDGLPCNPLGPPGPIVITLAALAEAQIPARVVDAGSSTRPTGRVRTIGDRPGDTIVSGRAVPNARDLFEAGLALGRELAEETDYLILGESVPGGTTTALAILLALGISAESRVSSSLAENSHPLKLSTVREAFRAAGIRKGSLRADPIEAIARVGDPMQAAQAGIAIAAARRIPVVLAGGSQMAAVCAVIAALSGRDGQAIPPGRIGVATTGWVARDTTADVPGLFAEIGAFTAVAADLNFSISRHAPLRRYEAGLVKEGVGAGGAAVACLLRTRCTAAGLTSAIDRLYGDLLARGLVASQR